MPNAQTILSWATAVANDWRWLAICWHGALAVVLLALVRGWTPSRRLLGGLLALPCASVATVAWATGNPFNGAMFAVLLVVLVLVVSRLPPTPAIRAPAGLSTAGGVLVGIGWVYPHFLEADAWTAYAYASPFGLLPCPTLLLVVGVTVIFDGLSSRSWRVLLSLAGIVYGVIGVFGLGVYLDLWLLAGAILLVVSVPIQGRVLRGVRLQPDLFAGNNTTRH